MMKLMGGGEEKTSKRANKRCQGGLAILTILMGECCILINRLIQVHSKKINDTFLFIQL